MKKECVSRQPEVGARALAQGVKIGDVGISKRNSTGANAFTLAEVLLTLAIIGVVAALTIPAVVTKITKDQYVVGLKKAYNTLKAIEREARQEYGEMENWTSTPGADSTADFERYFLPYFDVLKNCGATTETGCHAEKITFLNGEEYTDNFNTTEYYKIVTSDGISWAYSKYGDTSSPTVWGIFYVDVNGLKGPNRYGRDIFAFHVYPSNLGIKPYGSYGINNSSDASPMPTSTIDADCNTSEQGNFCTAKVLAEGAMNY